MNPYVKSVAALDDYKLALVFENGEQRIPNGEDVSRSVPVEECLVGDILEAKKLLPKG